MTNGGRKASRLGSKYEIICLKSMGFYEILPNPPASPATMRSWRQVLEQWPPRSNPRSRSNWQTKQSQKNNLPVIVNYYSVHWRCYHQMIWCSFYLVLFSCLNRGSVYNLFLYKIIPIHRQYLNTCDNLNKFYWYLQCTKTRDELNSIIFIL